MAQSVRGVMEKACCPSPNFKIVMSTLLPRKDFHQNTIQKVNISIFRDCQQWPNVHVVHYPSLTVQDLNDDVYLSKERFHWLLRHWKMSHWTKQERQQRRPKQQQGQSQPGTLSRVFRGTAGPAHSDQRAGEVMLSTLLLSPLIMS